jgi:transposase-like protein
VRVKLDFSMRIEKKIVKVCVLVVIGVDQFGIKQVVALQAGDKESSGTWRQFFKNYKVPSTNFKYSLKIIL